MREGEGERKFPNLSNVENTSDLIISGVYFFKNIKYKYMILLTRITLKLRHKQTDSENER